MNEDIGGHIGPDPWVVDQLSRPVNELAAALAKFQAEMPTVAKTHTATVRSDKGSYSYTYADLADVTEAAMPLLSKQGLSFSCLPGERVILGVLMHSSGQYVTASLPISGANPQQVGSSLTYMRRYLLGCMTGVVTDDDDDGAAASAPARKPPPRRPTVSGPVEPVDLPPVVDAPGPESDRITVPQQRNLRRLLADYGLGGKDSRDEVLALASQVVGRDIGSSSDLSRVEASRLIDHLSKQLGELPSPEEES